MYPPFKRAVIAGHKRDLAKVAPTPKAAPRALLCSGEHYNNHRDISRSDKHYHHHKYQHQYQHHDKYQHHHHKYQHQYQHHDKYQHHHKYQYQRRNHHGRIHDGVQLFDFCKRAPWTGGFAAELAGRLQLWFQWFAWVLLREAERSRHYVLHSDSWCYAWTPPYCCRCYQPRRHCNQPSGGGRPSWFLTNSDQCHRWSSGRRASKRRLESVFVVWSWDRKYSRRFPLVESCDL